MSIEERNWLRLTVEAFGRIGIQFWSRKGTWPVKTSGGAAFAVGWYPVFGWLVGAVIALAAVLFSNLFHPWAGAVIFAAVTWVLLTFTLPGEGEVVIAGRLASYFPEGRGLPSAKILLYALLLIGKLILLLLLGVTCPWQLPLLLAWTALLSVAVYTVGRADIEIGRNALWPMAVLSVLSLIPAARSVFVFTLTGILALRYFAGRENGRRSISAERSFPVAVCCWLLLLLGVLFPG